MWFHSVCTAQKYSAKGADQGLQSSGASCRYTCWAVPRCPAVSTISSFFSVCPEKTFIFPICRRVPDKKGTAPLPDQLLKFNSIIPKISLINPNLSWLPFFLLPQQYLLISSSPWLLFKVYLSSSQTVV